MESKWISLFGKKPWIHFRSTFFYIRNFCWNNRIFFFKIFFIELWNYYCFTSYWITIIMIMMVLGNVINNVITKNFFQINWKSKTIKKHRIQWRKMILFFIFQTVTDERFTRIWQNLAFFKKIKNLFDAQIDFSPCAACVCTLKIIIAEQASKNTNGWCVCLRCYYYDDNLLFFSIRLY